MFNSVSDLTKMQFKNLNQFKLSVWMNRFKSLILLFVCIITQKYSWSPHGILCPCWIEVLIPFKKREKFLLSNFWMVVYVNQFCTILITMVHMMKYIFSCSWKRLLYNFYLDIYCFLLFILNHLNLIHNKWLFGAWCFLHMIKKLKIFCSLSLCMESIKYSN